MAFVIRALKVGINAAWCKTNFWGKQTFAIFKIRLQNHWVRQVSYGKLLTARSIKEIIKAYRVGNKKINI